MKRTRNKLVGVTSRIVSAALALMMVLEPLSVYAVDNNQIYVDNQIGNNGSNTVQQAVYPQISIPQTNFSTVADNAYSVDKVNAQPNLDLESRFKAKEVSSPPENDYDIIIGWDKIELKDNSYTINGQYDWEAVNKSREEALKTVLNILNNKKKYSELSSEEKDTICKFFDINEELLSLLDKKDCSLADAINKIKIVSLYGFSLSFMKEVLKDNPDKVKLRQNVSTLGFFIYKGINKYEKDKDKDEYRKSFEKLFRKGYDTRSIVKSFLVSKALKIDIGKAITKKNSNSKITKNTLTANKTGQSKIKDIADKYAVDESELSAYADTNKKSAKDIEKAIAEVNKEYSSVIGQPAAEDNSLIAANKSLYSAASSGNQAQNRAYINQYVNPPFYYRKNAKEYINPREGVLNYQSTDFVLPGRNGMDLTLGVKYSSDNYYTPQYTAECSEDSNGNENWFMSLPKSGRTYVREQDGIGRGWTFGLPWIEMPSSSDNPSSDSNVYVHLGNGEIYQAHYKYDSTMNAYYYELLGYGKKDVMMVESNDGYIRGLLLSYKDGSKQYFYSDGTLYKETDRYNNTIQYYYSRSEDGGRVLSQVIDSAGRGINIRQATSGNTKTTEIVPPSGNSIKYISENVNNVWLLKKIVDQNNNTTKFDYSVVDGYFNGTNPNNREPKLERTYANLTKITYPTGATSNYDYEDVPLNVTGNNCGEAKSDRYRIKLREDINKGASMNRESYEYTEEWSWKPDPTNPINTIPFHTFTTTATDAYNNKRKNWYVNYIDRDYVERSQQTNDQIIPNGSNMPIKEVKYQQLKGTIGIRVDGSGYVSPFIYTQFENISVVTTYDYSGTAWTSKETVAEENEYGDVVRSGDEEGKITISCYDSTFHQLIGFYKWNKNMRVQGEGYSINFSNGNIERSEVSHFQNGGITLIETNYGYDAYGNRIWDKLKRQDGVIVQNNYEYGAQYNGAYLTRKYVNVTNRDGSVSTAEEKYTYDYGTGNRTSVTDGNGNTTYCEYDPCGRVKKVTNPDNTTVKLDYNDTDNIETITDENGNKARIVYDGLGNEIRREQFENGAWKVVGQKSYNSLGQVYQIIDGNNNITSYQYDVFGRTTRVTNPDQTYTTTLYDNYNKTKTEIDEEGDLHYYYYDTMGRLTNEKVTPDKNNRNIFLTTSYSYDECGNLRSRTDANNHVTYYYYDNLGWLRGVTNALNETTQYDYDNTGELINITFPNGTTSKKYYDEAGRLARQTDQSGKIEYSSYDGAGNLKTFTDRKGQTTTYLYDTRSRLKQKTCGSINVSYGYDNAGNVQTVTDAGGTTTNQYYEDGLLNNQILPGNKTLHYEYDNNGNCKKLVDIFGKATSYSYDNRNRLKTVEFDGRSTGYNYYPDSCLKNIIYPGSTGITESFSYDGARNLLSVANTKGGAVLSQFSYTYDNVGNQKTKTDAKGLTSYDYDVIDRVTAEKYPDASSNTYAYDNMGNRKQAVKAVDDIMNDVTELDSSYKYDEFDRLIGVTKTGKTLSYSYNDNGLRLSKNSNGVVTNFIWSGANNILETDASNNLKKRYIRGTSLIASQDANNVLKYYLYDGHGNVVQMTDEQGNVIKNYDYDAFGNEKNQDPNDDNAYRYCGEYYDKETGLYYLRARYYDPKDGRFIGEDSVEGKLDNPASLNLYVYCWDNPVRYKDSDGNYPKDSNDGDGDGNDDEAGGRPNEGFIGSKGSATELATLDRTCGGEWTYIEGKYYVEAEGKIYECTENGDFVPVKRSSSLGRKVKAAIKGAGEANSIYSKVSNVISKMSNKLKVNGKCDAFASKLVAGLKKAGIKYEIIRIDSKVGIYSDKAGDAIGDGFHYGIKIGNMVYDNMTLNGMPFDDWLTDLGADGSFADITWRVTNTILSR